MLLAAPMRRHFIVDEKLPFPDGMAAGETLIVLDPPRGASRGDAEWDHARRAAMVLCVGLLASGLLMLLRDDAKIFELVPEGWDPGRADAGRGRAPPSWSPTMGVGRRYSLLSVGTGMIVGLRVNTWMLVGGVIGWIVAPLLLIGHGVLPDHATRTQVLYWVMWPGIGMMMAGGLTALALRWRLLVEAFRGLAGASASARNSRCAGSVGGILVLTVAALRDPEAVLRPAGVDDPGGGRVLGAADAGRPAGAGRDQLGPDRRALQPDAGPLRRHRAGQRHRQHPGQRRDRDHRRHLRGPDAGLQAGHMIGSTPRSMTIAQLIGAPIGAAALALTYPALVKTYGMIGEHAQLAAPGSRRTAGFAELLSGGLDKLPPSALWAMLAVALLGVAVRGDGAEPAPQALDAVADGPGPGHAAAVLLPGHHVPRRRGRGLSGSARSPASASAYLMPLASGLIAGEAMVAVIVPVLLWLGLGKG